jgi:hypothetical protein
MSISYQASNENVLACQLKVQSLTLPFSVAGNATPGSVVVTVQDPSILFINTQGVNQITAALQPAYGDVTPTFAAATDSTGVFNLLVWINPGVPIASGNSPGGPYPTGDQVAHIHEATITCMDPGSPSIFAATLPTAPANGIVQGGNLDKMVFNATSPSAFNVAGTHNYTLEVQYTVITE